jgi:hypothetical protein
MSSTAAGGERAKEITTRFTAEAAHILNEQG